MTHRPINKGMVVTIADYIDEDCDDVDFIESLRGEVFLVHKIRRDDYDNSITGCFLTNIKTGEPVLSGEMTEFVFYPYELKILNREDKEWQTIMRTEEQTTSR